MFPNLLKLLETMSAVGGMLMKIMALYSCVSYSFATVGMAIFADATSDVLPARCVTCSITLFLLPNVRASCGP